MTVCDCVSECVCVCVCVSMRACMHPCVAMHVVLSQRVVVVATDLVQWLECTSAWSMM